MAQPPNRPNEELRLERRDKMAKALELRKEGKTYRDIADDLGYTNPGNAYRAVQDALKEVTREPAEEVLQLELSRLDMLLTAMLPYAMQGDEKAVLRVLNIMDRRAKYLGLDDAIPPDTSAEARAALTGLMDALAAAATPEPATE